MKNKQISIITVRPYIYVYYCGIEACYKCKSVLWAVIKTIWYKKKEINNVFINDIKKP